MSPSNALVHPVTGQPLKLGRIAPPPIAGRHMHLPLNRLVFRPHLLRMLPFHRPPDPLLDIRLDIDIQSTILIPAPGFGRDVGSVRLR